MISPLLVIRCLTYNHEPFIRDCLEGFVMQKTNFPFVAIVHDDASTDHTADIVREYAEKYPDIIHPIFETENQYSKRDGSLGRIMNEAIAATGCKYIAMCEGDDYWIDPLKLQKQVELLESKPECHWCGCGYYDYNENTKTRGLGSNYNLSGWIFDDSAKFGPVAATCTLVYRRGDYVDKEMSIKYCVVAGDYLLQAELAHESQYAFIPDIMAVYRISGVGVSHRPWKDYSRVEYLKGANAVRRYLAERYPDSCRFSSVELDDSDNYAYLKHAIAIGNYRMARQHQALIVTDACKKKMYCKFLKGRISFAILRMAIKYKE